MRTQPPMERRLIRSNRLEPWLIRSKRLPRSGRLESPVEACIETEFGLASPQACVLRGDDPVTSWLPKELLWEACGKSFALASNPTELLHDTFGFAELVACLTHEGGVFLQRAEHMRATESKNH
mmetsp:Transcript_17909/g.42130  ORF Transcript_17909/g.42130 Transcript_17909/m.42130 type:complete len:124 (+) Transcript_17909:73-444(+)